MLLHNVYHIFVLPLDDIIEMFKIIFISPTEINNRRFEYPFAVNHSLILPVLNKLFLGTRNCVNAINPCHFNFKRF